MYQKKVIQKSQMKKKQTLSGNFRKVLENIKENYLSNVSIVEELGILIQSVLIQNKRIVMMKSLAVIRKIKRIRPYTRRSFRKIRKTSIPKKTMKSYSWD